MTQTFEPIDSELGVIGGRDAFYLDDISFDYRGNTVTLIGQINGHLCSRNELNLEWIKYSLVFSGVIGFRMVELDFSGFTGISSFDCVSNSSWLENMRREDSAGKVKKEHKHYVLMTYDDVFDVICSGFSLTVER